MCLAAQLLGRTGADSLFSSFPWRSKDDASNGSKNGIHEISGGRGASGGAHHWRSPRMLTTIVGSMRTTAERPPRRRWWAPPIIRFGTRNVLRCASSENGGYVGRCPWGGVRGAVSVGRCPNMTNFSRCRRGTMTDAVRRPAETRSICRKGRLLHPGSVGDCGDC
jgi:hypothetical protein